MRGLLFGLVALAGLAFAGTATAQDYRYSGHNRGHYDYVPGHYDRHRGHYDYHPGHYEYHRGPIYVAPNYPRYSGYDRDGDCYSPGYRGQSYYTPGGHRHRPYYGR